MEGGQPADATYRTKVTEPAEGSAAGTAEATEVLRGLVDGRARADAGAAGLSPPVAK